jgi:hypothetical protein
MRRSSFTSISSIARRWDGTHARAQVLFWVPFPILFASLGDKSSDPTRQQGKIWASIFDGNNSAMPGNEARPCLANTCEY